MPKKLISVGIWRHHKSTDPKQLGSCRDTVFPWSVVLKVGVVDHTVFGIGQHRSMDWCHLRYLPATTRKNIFLNNSLSAVMFCSWRRNAGMAHSICGCMRGWQVKLCDPSLTHATPEPFSGESDSMQRIIQMPLYSITYFTLNYQLDPDDSGNL